MRNSKFTRLGQATHAGRICWPGVLAGGLNPSLPGVPQGQALHEGKDDDAALLRRPHAQGAMLCGGFRFQSNSQSLPMDIHGFLVGYGPLQMGGLFWHRGSCPFMGFAVLYFLHFPCQPTNSSLFAGGLSLALLTDPVKLPTKLPSKTETL